MSLSVIILSYLLKESKSQTKTAGNNFTDKRFFTDKTLIKTKNVTFCFIIFIFAKKGESKAKTAGNVFTDNRFFTDKH